MHPFLFAMCILYKSIKYSLFSFESSLGSESCLKHVNLLLERRLFIRLIEAFVDRPGVLKFSHRLSLENLFALLRNPWDVCIINLLFFGHSFQIFRASVLMLDLVFEERGELSGLMILSDLFLMNFGLQKDTFFFLSLALLSRLLILKLLLLSQKRVHH